MGDIDVQDYLRRQRDRVDAAIAQWLPPDNTPPESIHKAMRYAVLGGGKRLRPILAIAAAESCGVETEPWMQQFAALELIHTYSLVHDDLPALDDDELRRGRKTVHVVFGEALAILTGDALLTEAMSWLSKPARGVPADRQLRGLAVVASAVDSQGMIGGQVADLESERMQERTSDRKLLAGTLSFIHENKTGALITGAVMLGGILAGAHESVLRELERYGRAVGLAFQIVDDLLDIEESAATLGKTAGKDVAQGKLTYPALFGVEEARNRAAALLEEAVGSADTIGGPVNYLGPIARYIIERRS
ncbi:MAG: polyprenyl synthetase family protein [Thermoanaerobaculia bacterium]